MTEPNEQGAYEWTGKLGPGERREAGVRYGIVGARSWHYDIGSRRRRVQQFSLVATAAGPVRFMRYGLQPTARSDNELSWNLANVVTAQQIALAFPPDVVGRKSYLQALSVLPTSFVLFLLGVLVAGWRSGGVPEPGRLAMGLVLFALGLGPSTVLANYLGSVASVIIAPLIGAFWASVALGWRSHLAALPAALLPARF